MAKRLIFSTNTPNDQGGIVPSETINLERYLKNPVLLSDHQWWTGALLGRLEDVRCIDGVWSGVPVFHLETQASREAAGMYAKDALNAASVGGHAIWKTNTITGEYERTAKGFRVCEIFYVYEVSLLPIPSNMDAVGEDMQLKSSYQFYEESGVSVMDSALTHLSSKFFKMPEVKPTTTEPGAAAPTAQQQAAPGSVATEHTTLGASTNVNDLPPIIKQVLAQNGSVTFSGVGGTTLAAPTPKDEPASTIPGKIVGDDPQPGPIGLGAQKAQKAFRVMNKARTTAADALKALTSVKTKLTGDESNTTLKSEYETLKLAAEKACEAAEKKEEEYNAAQEEADDEEMSAKEKQGAKGGTTTLGAVHGGRYAAPPAAQTEPVMLSAAEMKGQLKLATAPSFRDSINIHLGADSQGITFTKLFSTHMSEEAKKIKGRLFDKTKNTGLVNTADHLVVLNSMLNDPRLSKPETRDNPYGGLMQKVRLHVNAKDQQAVDSQKNYNDGRFGSSLTQLASDFHAGRVEYWDKQGGDMKQMTMLTSTDNALAAPALNTIEWLSLAIFELFPTTSWKAPIPMFGAQMTSRNTGIILANIVANPAIYKGTSPAPAGDYSYTDQAVALALTPYWLQPMVWKPLDMHQLRYDQMSTGWAQAFALWNSIIDDNLLYTLASTVPAGSILPTSGLTGGNAQAMQFNIPGSGPQNKFYWNQNFNGNLLAPTLNDIIALEQIYRNQNFSLEREKGMLVMDSIFERYFASDPETKSLLTRWISADGEDFKGFKHTMFDVRSRVAVYDPATGQVKDINGAIPGTSTSAAVGFIPSQVGIGIGMLDVFMIQDPTNYGYRMSADMRIGIVPLRYNFFGTSLLVFGQGNV